MVLRLSEGVISNPYEYAYPKYIYGVSLLAAPDLNNLYSMEEASMEALIYWVLNINKKPHQNYHIVFHLNQTRNEKYFCTFMLKKIKYWFMGWNYEILWRVKSSFTDLFTAHWIELWINFFWTEWKWKISRENVVVVFLIIGSYHFLLKFCHFVLFMFPEIEFFIAHTAHLIFLQIFLSYII